MMDNTFENHEDILNSAIIKDEDDNLQNMERYVKTLSCRSVSTRDSAADGAVSL